MVEVIWNYVVADSQYAIEFEQNGVFLFLYLPFWRDNQLCRVLLKRTGRVVGQTQTKVSLLASLLSVISTQPSRVSCNGCLIDLIQLLDKNLFFRQGIQSVKRFEGTSLHKLMHKKLYSVFGRIDFFSVIEYILVCLGGSLHLGCLTCSRVVQG